MVMAVFNGRAMTKQSDGTLKVVPNAHIEVRSQVAGLPLAALKSNRDGTSALANPFDADADGKFSFYVVGGAYQIRAYTGSSGSPDTEDFIYHEAIGLNAESDSIASRTRRSATDAATVTVSVDDVDDIFITGTAARVDLPASAGQSKSKKVFDGRFDANTNNIKVYPASGEKMYGVVDGYALIDGNGGMVELTPREDGTGWQ